MSAQVFRDFKRNYPVITRGKGVFLYDREGRAYLDAVGGIAVVNVGHGVPEIIAAMTEQAQRVAFVHGGAFANEPAMALTEELATWTPAGLRHVMLLSGGSEATETAMKLARQYHLERGKAGKYRIVSRWTSYHGNTIGALSMSGRTAWRGEFVPYLQSFPKIHPPYCYRCPYGKTYPSCQVACAEDLERVIRLEGPDSIAAFIAEPVIGTSAAGVTPPPEYYPRIREICDRYDVLFIADEVITGVGRTGRNFGIDHWGVIPDMITTAKALSSGYAPLAAVILHDRVYEAIARGSARTTQGFTYSGHPLSAAVGLAVLRYLRAHDLVANAGRIGRLLLERLAALARYPIVGDVRGTGLILGVEFVADQATKRPFPPEAEITRRIVEAVLEEGVVVVPGMSGLIDSVAGDHIQISPPYIFSEANVDQLVAALDTAIQKVMREVGTARAGG
ncbi:MAG: aminotransferase class III-fold pyridoxal phosphate-dependent enzyme [candidate division NC10 bacterium]|nr:aminotransferase class III-fold pyridoxal phosphate-dependent enzyme [candidate division NC10 bacterium]